MALTVGELLVKLKAETRQFQRDLNRVGRGFKKLGVTSAGLRTSFIAVGAAAAGLAFGLKKLTARGGEVINVQRAFARVSGDSVAAINELESATRGLINRYDLMVGLNRALTLGSAENTQQFAELARTALTLGRALGVDARFALESLSLGIGRQSRLILDNLGLIVSIESANKNYAKALRKTVKELTDSEKREAFRTAALESARAKVEELGGITETGADSVQRFAISLRNLADAAAVAVTKSSLLIDMMRKLTNALRPGNEEFERQRDLIVALGDDETALARKYAELGTIATNLSVRIGYINKSIFTQGQLDNKTATSLALYEKRLIGVTKAIDLLQAKLISLRRETTAQPAALEAAGRALPRLVGGAAFETALGGAPLVRDIVRSWEKARLVAIAEMGQFERAVGAELIEVGRSFAETMRDVGIRAGVQLIAGIITGAKGQQNILRQTLVTIFTIAVELSVRAALGIASPSKVMMKLGEETIEGFRLGMEQMAGPLALTSRKLAAIPAQAAAAGATFNINADFSQIPGAMTPGEAALSAAWRDLFSETLFQLEQGGFRLRGQ